MFFNVSDLLSNIRNNSLSSLDLYKERFMQAEDFKTTATLKGHTSSFFTLAVLADGRLISGSRDGNLCIWDLSSSQCVATLQGHTDAVNALAMLPNGYIVSGSRDYTLRIWDVSSRRCVTTLQGHTDAVNALTVLSNGHLVSGSNYPDNSLRIWDISSRQCITIFKGHKDAVNALAILPTGHIISGSKDTTLRIWDVSLLQCIAILKGHIDAVNSLAVLSDGRIASGSNYPDNSLRIWDSSLFQCIAILKGHTLSINALLVLPNGYIVSGSSDYTLRIWDTSSRQCMATLKGHTNSVYALAQLSSGGIVSGSNDKTLRIWEICLPIISLDDLDKIIHDLKSNTSINFVNFANMKLSVYHINAIANLLTVNTYITSLDLSNNSLSDAAVEKLLQALGRNTSLIKLNLERNSISDVVKSKFDTLMQRNKQHQEKVLTNANKRASIVDSSSDNIIDGQSKKLKRIIPLSFLSPMSSSVKTSSSASSSCSSSSHSSILPSLSTIKPAVKQVIPEEFTCIITKELMQDPIVAEDSYSYERKAILKWIEEKGTSPINPTIELKKERLIPNKNLKDAIERFRKETELTSTNVSYNVFWDRYLQLSYGNFAGIVPDDKHIEYRTIVADLYQKDKEPNYVLCAVGFLYEIINKSSSEEKNYLFYSIDVKGKSKAPHYLHVKNTYGSGFDADKSFLDDLKRYHSDKQSEVEKIFYQAKQRFITFHHSERAFFKHLENPTTITYLIDEFEKQLKSNNPVKIKAVVIDMVSTRYLCKWCEPAIAYFQHPSSPFLTKMAEQLTETTKGNMQRFQIPKKGLFAITRYSAEFKGGQMQKTKEEHSSNIIDLKQIGKQGKSLILQRDNKVILGEVEKLTVASSRLNVKVSKNSY